MSTYSTNLALELIGTGEQAGVWGTTTNTNLGTLIEQAISGYVTQAVSTGTDTTITIPNGSSGVARNMYIELTGTGGASTNLIVPANKKLYFIFNNSTGAVTVKVSGQTGVSVPTGKKMVLVSNGTDIVNGLNYIADFASNSATITHLSATSATITNLTLTSLVISNLSIASANITTLTGSTQTLSGNLTLNGGTANGVLYLNASKVATSGSALVFDGTTLTSQAGVTSGVGGGGKYTIAYTTANANSRSWRIINDVNAYGDFAIQQSTTQAGSTYADIVSINSSGNVGIGTASPTQKLEVAGSGNAFVSNGQAIVSAGSGITYSARLSCAYNFPFVDTYLDSVAGASYSGQIIFRTSSGGGAMTERMRLDSSGNLGIGTASPGFKLDVNAGASPAAAQFQSSSSTYADFLNGTITGRIQTISSDFFIGTATAGASLAFKTDNNTERMRLDSSGNLGIGTASPGERLDVRGGGLGVGNGTIKTVISYTTEGLVGTVSNHALLLYANNAERARLTSGGNLLVGKASEFAQAFRFVVEANSSTSAIPGCFADPRTDAASAITVAFYRNGTKVGSVDTTDVATAYVTSSDRRLKDNIVSADDAGSVIDAIEVVKHDWKVGGHTRYGMIAQDLHMVVPEAVSVGDADDVEDFKNPWGVDYSKLVPMMMKELQSLRKRVAELESK